MPLTWDDASHRRSTAQRTSANLGGRFGPQVSRAPASYKRRYPSLKRWEGTLLRAERTRGAQPKMDPAEALHPISSRGE